MSTNDTNSVIEICFSADCFFVAQAYLLFTTRSYVLCIDYPIDTMVFLKQCQGLSKVHIYLLCFTYRILILLYALKTVSTIEQSKA